MYTISTKTIMHAYAVHCMLVHITGHRYIPIHNKNISINVDPPKSIVTLLMITYEIGSTGYYNNMELCMHICMYMYIYIYIHTQACVHLAPRGRPTPEQSLIPSLSLVHAMTEIGAPIVQGRHTHTHTHTHTRKKNLRDRIAVWSHVAYS